LFEQAGKACQRQALQLITKITAIKSFTTFTPGRFEYPNLNGYYSPKQAVKLCEEDLSCGGFTYKGTPKSPQNSLEVFFFHYVPMEWFGKDATIDQDPMLLNFFCP
jgi:hypothetical protein